ncbi:MAG: nuclear transport factor 2 family protein [Luteimonas sp.]|nr:nuclear transport factor 2 family protein [Luteimonas sp.]
MRIDGNRRHDRGTELVLAYYAAFNRGDWGGMLALLSEDVVHDLNQGPRETGRDAFAAFLQRMHRCYREQLRDIVVMATADGARVAAEYVVHGEYLVADEGLPPAHGQRYVLPGGAFFEIAFDEAGGSGRIARVSNYYNLEDWLRQVR